MIPEVFGLLSGAKSSPRMASTISVPVRRSSEIPNSSSMWYESCKEDSRSWNSFRISSERDRILLIAFSDRPNVSNHRATSRSTWT